MPSENLPSWERLNRSYTFLNKTFLAAKIWEIEQEKILDLLDACPIGDPKVGTIYELLDKSDERLVAAFKEDVEDIRGQLTYKNTYDRMTADSIYYMVREAEEISKIVNDPKYRDYLRKVSFFHPQKPNFAS